MVNPGAQEGIRIGTVRRPPRGIQMARYAPTTGSMSGIPTSRPAQS
jgi:uncharacterized protein YeaO (DUF488 family)